MAKMSKMDQVEQIREKTGVSYEEAKDALEAADGDVLDAIIALEREGKVKSAATASTSTSVPADDAASVEMQKAQAAYEESTSKGSFKKDLDNLWVWLKNALDKSMEIKLIGTRHGEVVFTLPLIVLVLGLIFWGATLWLLIIGLFFGFRYEFEGVKKTKVEVDVNDIMDKAADKVDDIKEDFKKHE